MNKFLIYTIIFLAVSVIVAGQQFNITSNSTYNVSLSNATLLNYTFFCEPPVYNQTNYNLYLSPGDNTSFRQNGINVIAYCKANVSNTLSKCSVTTTLSGSQNYTNTAGACDVHISSVETQQSCPTIPNVDNRSVHESVQVVKNNGSITFSAGNQTFSIPNDAPSYTYDYGFNIQCPNTKNVTFTQNNSQILSLCQEYAPFLVNDWIKPTLLSCRNQASEYVSEVKNCSTATAGYQKQLGDLKAQISSQTAQLNQVLSSKQALNDQITALNTKVAVRTAFAIIGWVFALTMMGLAGMLFIFRMGGGA